MSYRRMNMALVGCGDISENYLLSAALIPKSMKITKLMDVSESNAAARSRQFGIPYTTDFKEVLNDPSIEAVIISVPHYLHKPLAVQAAKAGKHVLLDKPVATNAADSRAIILACEKYGVRLNINFPRRGMAANKLARKIIRQGVIGKVTYLTISEYTDKAEDYWTKGNHGLVATDWRTSKEKSGGGCVLMNVSHNLDQLMMITGLRVRRVTGFTATLATPVEVEDAGGAVLQYDNGALGTITVASIFRGKNGPFYEPMRIAGTHGQLIIGNPLLVYTLKKKKGYTAGAWTPVPYEETLLVQEKGYHGGHYAGILKDTVSAIRNNGPVPCSGEDGLHSLQTVLGLYRSSDTGRTVTLK